MPVRIAEVYLAEPAITPSAILGGDNHPMEKRPGRIPRPAYFFLCLEFPERWYDPRGSTLL